MLDQFLFTNYKLFRDETLLSFSAGVKENSSKVLIDKVDGEKFLPVVAIYGANGEGKSTVLQALEDLKNFIVYPISCLCLFKDNDDIEFLKHLKPFNTNDKYYKFDDRCKDLPICFDIMFRIKNKQFRYQISLLHNEILEEILYMKFIKEKSTSIVFERVNNECFLSEPLEGVSICKIQKTIPLLSYLKINFDFDVIDDVVLWFKNLVFFNDNITKKEYQLNLISLIKNETKVFTFLQELDINIFDLHIEKNIYGNIQEIYFLHKLKNGNVFRIQLEDEATGIKKLIFCLAAAINCLTNGSLMIADNLDANLHPKFLRYIIKLFTDLKINKYGAQLLFTSHNSTIMLSEVFRKDEIWFSAIDQTNSAILYPLTVFKNETTQESFSDQYLNGGYTAISYTKVISNWNTI